MATGNASSATKNILIIATCARGESTAYYVEGEVISCKIQMSLNFKSTMWDDFAEIWLT